ncbi:MAG TPA: hypothetical protein VJ697_15390 [Nitrososphaeraceae archaeon]|nr:hypothetical protein [Nitrososphaeraceae archaeon]
MKSQSVVITSITLTVITLLLVVSIQSGSGYNSQEIKNQQPLLSIISTMDTPIFSLGHLIKLVSILFSSIL